MSESSLTTRDQVTPAWVAAVVEAVLVSGDAFRAGAGSTIEVESPALGWMPLLLPGGSPHFDTKETRDGAVALLWDEVQRARFGADAHGVGREGRRAGSTLEANPYDPASPRWRWWRLGWLAEGAPIPHGNLSPAAGAAGLSETNEQTKS